MPVSTNNAPPTFRIRGENRHVDGEGRTVAAAVGVDSSTVSSVAGPPDARTGSASGIPVVLSPDDRSRVVTDSPPSVGRADEPSYVAATGEHPEYVGRL